MTISREQFGKNKHWNTPIEYIAALKEMWGEIDFDPCSNEFSLVGANTSLVKGGLEADWSGYKTIYVNPPFGRDGKNSIKYWLEKICETSRIGNNQIVALIPVSTNTNFWQNTVFKFAKSICFIKTPRIKFGIEGNFNNKGAPMACCFVYWGKNCLAFEEIFSKFGKSVRVN